MFYWPRIPGQLEHPNWHYIPLLCDAHTVAVEGFVPAKTMLENGNKDRDEVFTGGRAIQHASNIQYANIVGKMGTGKRNVKNHTEIAKGLTVNCEGTMPTSMYGLAPSQRDRWVNKEKASANARKNPICPAKELRTWKNPLTLICSLTTEPVCTSLTEALMEQSD
jgi:hypothetical protein